MTPLPDVLEEAKRLLNASSDKKVLLRLIGGVAVALRCPSARDGRLQRRYGDIDFLGHEKQSKAINEFFVEMGYQPRVRFNAMMGRNRLSFNDLANQRRVDIFLDAFEMCHRFDFSERIELEPLTLPLADLLVTKLQIVQINDKDLRDLTALFLDHEVGSADGETINGPYIAGLCSGDWGIYKTLTTNLSNLAVAVDAYGLTQSEASLVKARIEALSDFIEKEPKSFAWRMRARVGEKKQWYELPEADTPVAVGPHD